MKEMKVDVCVIGAGSGGLSVASGSAQLGVKTVLIEKGEMGGDPCAPSPGAERGKGDSHRRQQERQHRL